MSKYKVWGIAVGVLAAASMFSVGIAFAGNYYSAGSNPTFTQQSKGIYVYNDGSEDLIVLDARDISNLKIYSDEWDGVVAAQLAPVFDEAYDYAAGDIVVYDNRLFRCTTPTTHDGSFPASRFESVRVTELLSGTGADLQALKQAVDLYHETVIGVDAGAYDDQHIYNKGEACTNDGKIYVCKVDDSTLGAFRSEEFEPVTLISFMSQINRQIAVQEKKLSDAEGMLADGWMMGTDYVAGDYTISDDTLYVCLNDVTGSATAPSEDTVHFKPVKISDVLKDIDDFKMSVSKEHGSYKLTITKVN